MFHFGPECCKSVTVFKSCGDPGGCANVLFTGRPTSKEVLYDTLTKPQQERMDAATTSEWDKWNELGVTKFLCEKQLIDIMKQNPHQRIVGSDGEGHPGQAGIQGRVRRARMSGRQELRQDRCPHRGRETLSA